MAELRLIASCDAAKNPQDDVVPHLVRFKRDSVIVGKFARLHPSTPQQTRTVSWVLIARSVLSTRPRGGIYLIRKATRNDMAAIVHSRNPNECRAALVLQFYPKGLIR